MSSSEWIFPALVSAGVGAAVGYALGARSRDDEVEHASVGAYRQGLQDGHNRLAAKSARKAKQARITAPKRDTMPDV